MQKNLVFVHKDFYVKADYWVKLRLCSQLFHLFKICLLLYQKKIFSVYRYSNLE